MAYGITVRRRVEFSETDMLRIVHFSNYFRFIEYAETAFYRSLGVSLVGCGVGWPRVHAEFDYKRPLRYEDEVEIAFFIQEKRSRSLAYAVSIRKVEVDGVVEAARGKLVVAAVQEDPATGALASVAIPESIARLIESAPPEALAPWMRTPSRA
ncbi:MAG: acyl-CoA thioesterase [Bryobacterales bacterium]|nr:acyl-CoA thioesterase [Bryobacterales bacterium]